MFGLHRVFGHVAAATIAIGVILAGAGLLALLWLLLSLMEAWARSE